VRQIRPECVTCNPDRLDIPGPLFGWLASIAAASDPFNWPWFTTNGDNNIPNPEIFNPSLTTLGENVGTFAKTLRGCRAPIPRTLAVAFVPIEMLPIRMAPT
jgi:hypothetical protein